jgi:hypothetical protein
MIPGEFYKAVAEVLAFVYMLKRKKYASHRIQNSESRIQNIIPHSASLLQNSEDRPI